MKRNQYITRRQRAILHRLADHADGKDPEDEWTLVSNKLGMGWHSGYEPCTRAARGLVYMMLIKEEFDSGDTIYWCITDAGRKALADPTYEPIGLQIQAGRVICDCPPEKREPTRFGTCGYCSRQLTPPGRD